MIGVFDSGMGALSAISEIRRLSPKQDISFYCDRKNAPYGTKTKSELITLVKRDVEILMDAGADSILMACCTASTVYEYLDENMKRICTPIIPPAARRAAELTKNGKVGVIATCATVRSKAFSRLLYSFPSVEFVIEKEAQALVSLVERGCRDGRVTPEDERAIATILSGFLEENIDTLILGCTHFPFLEGEIARLMPGVKIVSPSREGAIEILKNKSENGNGITISVDTGK